ncbi:hypothetical protein BU23DRAFT_192985 [Bimuria novae-zelandiae CBS 107.79]|uniref:Secreted protein n=1 Tax=Bimuria novae-zelandiae CBS 107.79 TaxID=1447943 RepID=A0A6A5VR05_9PLEO|nr:hypothetical protein BU23DRAFT_192985 [Bimuria novae-zelandiae CBS 107.79]
MSLMVITTGFLALSKILLGSLLSRFAFQVAHGIYSARRPNKRRCDGYKETRIMCATWWWSGAASSSSTSYLNSIVDTSCKQTRVAVIQKVATTAEQQNRQQYTFYLD